MSQEAMKALVDRFDGNDHKARELARQELVEAGREALPFLLVSLESRTRQVQWESAKALFSIGDPSTADALAETLEDEDLDVRWICGEALVKLGQRGLEALLRRMTQSSDTFLHESGHMVISRFMGSHKAVLQPVRDALRAHEPVETVMVAAGEALGKLTLESS